MTSTELDSAQKPATGIVRTQCIPEIKARATRRGYWFLRRVLPHTLAGDRVFAFYDFVVKLGRLPRRRLFFNDYLYQLKQSGEFLKLPRQIVSDKELCKLYVDSVIGPGRTIPTIAVLRRKEEVTEDAFPPVCVIKGTHTSGKTIIRRNGEALDLDLIRSFLDDSLYRRSREMNYKHLEPKVIVEPIVLEGEAIEFKIHCYRGMAKIISVQPLEEGTLERLDRQCTRRGMEQRNPSPRFRRQSRPAFRPFRRPPTRSRVPSNTFAWTSMSGMRIGLSGN